jgi:ABC-type branched-subunit amino acid transport system permease subunit
VFVEHELSQVTDLWPLVFGSIFIAFVMFAPEGIWGIVTARFKQKPIVPNSAGSEERSDAAA